MCSAIEIFTCGTHFGETKLVTSICENPHSDKRFTNSTFAAVGTIFYKEMTYISILYIPKQKFQGHIISHMTN